MGGFLDIHFCEGKCTGGLEGYFSMKGGFFLIKGGAFLRQQEEFFWFLGDTPKLLAYFGGEKGLSCCGEVIWL